MDFYQIQSAVEVWKYVSKIYFGLNSKASLVVGPKTDWNLLYNSGQEFGSLTMEWS